MMLSSSIPSTLPDLLSMAEQMRLIDGWKILGPTIMLRTSNANYYLTPSTIDHFFQGLNPTR